MGLLTSLKSVIDDAPLYSSNKDVDQPKQEVFTFTPDQAVEFMINEQPKGQEPAYSQTIIPQKVQIVPDVTKIESVDPETIKVDPEKMLKYFSEPVCSQIISDIQNKIPLSPEIAETLIKKDIIQDPELSETLPATKRVILPSNPVKKKSGSTLLNRAVNIIYNLLYQ